MEIPNFLYQKLELQYGKEKLNQIVEGYSKGRVVSFRINRLKTTIKEIEKELIDNEILFSKVAWYDDAFIIENKIEEDIRTLSIYQDGKIYLQSLSSMLPVFLLSPKEGESVLDMAAAPGGKTTQIASLSNDKTLITACEKNKIRLERLKYNIEKQGVRKITILGEDARYLDDYFSFDKILLDAPCSGSGTIQLENPHFQKYLKEELIEKSVKIQRELLKKALNVLKSGGEMIYSTCSILEDENEKQIESLLKENLVEIVPLDVSLLKEVPFLPTKIPGTLVVKPTSLYEGFFIAKLRKR